MVRYQGHSFQKKKMAVAGALVFHKHNLFLIIFQVSKD